MKDKFCHCGLVLIEKMGFIWCKRHGKDIVKKERETIPKYSGYSKNFKGGYEKS